MLKPPRGSATITMPDGTVATIVGIPTWAQVRDFRNWLLRECDWSQIGDVALTNDEKQTWKNYRKLLRDIPQTYSNPDDVIWPIPPVGPIGG